MTSTTLQIQGMRCAGCVASVEKGLRAQAGVTSASVNLLTNSAKVEFDEARANVGDLIKAVESTGFHATSEPSQSNAADDKSENSTTTSTPAEHSHPLHWLHHQLVRWLPLLAIPVVIMGMGWHTQRSAWIQFALAFPIQLVLGWPFYRGALHALRYRRADMDLLVALGTSVAFCYSFYQVYAGEHEVYFDTSAVILVLIGIGKQLEHRAKKNAGNAIAQLMNLQPPMATLLAAGREREVPVDRLRPNDIVLVRPGQRIPVDGIITKGQSTIDRSMVTGESMPVDVTVDESVIGGTLNQTGSFEMRATRTGKETLLAQIVKLVVDAQSSKADIQRLADRIAGIFVPVVLVIAMITLLGWGFYRHDWLIGMHAMVAVLIVACPCALGLATPTAVLVGTGLGAQHGILIKDAAALERAGKLTHVILDKTGTLTLGKPAVSDVLPIEIDPKIPTISPDALLALAAAVEKPSEHPIGQAIVLHAQSRNITPPPMTDFQSITAGGVMGVVAGRRVIVGRLSTLRQQNIANIDALSAKRDAILGSAKTIVAVAVAGHVVGFISLTDRLKPEAAEAVAALRKLKLKVIMMTGDNLATAQAIARPLNIDDVMADVQPQDKQAKVVALQKEHGIVAMVGDGINDAPALAAADIGIAMGSNFGNATGGGTDIAMEAGHVVLVGGDLRGLPRAITLSRATMKRILIGLAWAFAYNMLLIPIAVSGRLHPMLAGAAMAASSVSVVLNALYLRHSWKP